MGPGVGFGVSYLLGPVTAAPWLRARQAASRGPSREVAKEGERGEAALTSTTPSSEVAYSACPPPTLTTRLRVRIRYQSVVTGKGGVAYHLAHFVLVAVQVLGLLKLWESLSWTFKVLVLANALIFYTSQGILFDGDSKCVGHTLEVVRLTVVVLLATLPREASGRESSLALEHPACTALVLIHAASLVAILVPGGKQAISGSVSTVASGGLTREIKSQ